MNEQYVYNCYKFILKSNIPLSFLPKCNENFFMSDCIIDLSCYNEKTFDNEKIYCTKNNKDYIIESPLTSYVIDAENNRIKAYYKNKNELESTLIICLFLFWHIIVKISCFMQAVLSVIKKL